MKSLNTNKLTDAQASNDAFSRSVEKIKETAEVIERKSYTITKANIDYINDYAVKLTKQLGTPITASAALRSIINDHKERT